MAKSDGEHFYTILEVKQPLEALGSLTSTVPATYERPDCHLFILCTAPKGCTCPYNQVHWHTTCRQQVRARCSCSPIGHHASDGKCSCTVMLHQPSQERVRQNEQGRARGKAEGACTSDQSVIESKLMQPVQVVHLVCCAKGYNSKQGVRCVTICREKVRMRASSIQRAMTARFKPWPHKLVTLGDSRLASGGWKRPASRQHPG